MGRHRRLAIPFSAVLVLAACQTITEEMPTPTGPSGGVAGGPTVPVVVVPIVLPSPQAPAPAPTPAGTPGGTTPAPAPTAEPPSSQGCSLPRGNGSGDSCPRQSPSFLREVEAAIDRLVAEEPGLFNKNKTQGCGSCYEVRDWTRYTQRMAQMVTRNGLCGHYDGEELAVKNTNSFNDQYDILTSGGFIRRELGSYRSTCYPAWF
jgi:hypothetical protein